MFGPIFVWPHFWKQLTLRDIVLFFTQRYGTQICNGFHPEGPKLNLSFGSVGTFVRPFFLRVVKRLASDADIEPSAGGRQERQMQNATRE